MASRSSWVRPVETVAKYMVRRRGPPSQVWKTFLRNHVPHIGAMDLFVVPTAGFKLLYGLVIIRLSGDTWSGSTSQPIRRPTGSPARSTEAFPWEQAPQYPIRDRDASYGQPVTRRLAAMGIRDRPIRRECLDHVVILGVVYLRRILVSYASYHNE